MGSTEEVAQEEGMKRPRLLGISDLSDDVVGEVFKYLGRGHFLFVAGTSRQFYRVYQKTMRENDGNDSAGTTTTMGSAVESISRLQLARTSGYPWEIFASAARHGKLHVLQ